MNKSLTNLSKCMYLCTVQVQQDRRGGSLRRLQEVRVREGSWQGGTQRVPQDKDHHLRVQHLGPRTTICIQKLTIMLSILDMGVLLTLL